MIDVIVTTLFDALAVKSALWGPALIAPAIAVAAALALIGPPKLSGEAIAGWPLIRMF